MEKYSFTVKDVEEIDVNKILSETQEGSAGVIIFGGHRSRLFLREGFIFRFMPADNCYVAGDKMYRLPPSKIPWGDGWGSVWGSELFDPKRRLPDGWRCKQFDTESASAILEEIEAAKSLISAEVSVTVGVL